MDETTPLDATVVTWVSPELLDFLSGFGLPTPNDPGAINRLINDPLTWTTLAMERGSLPAADPSLPKYVPVRNTIEPVTLGEWNSAKGVLSLSCFADGTGRAEFRGRNLLPNMPYTFWAIHAATKQETFDATGSPLIFWPVGGMPVANTAGADGRINFQRDLHYCPLELEDPFLYLAVFPHYDGNVWGNQFGSSFHDGFGAGTSGAVQLCVPVGDALPDKKRRHKARS